MGILEKNFQWNLAGNSGKSWRNLEKFRKNQKKTVGKSLENSLIEISDGTLEDSGRNAERISNKTLLQKSSEDVGYKSHKQHRKPPRNSRNKSGKTSKWSLGTNYWRNPEINYGKPLGNIPLGKIIGKNSRGMLRETPTWDLGTNLE